MYFLKFPFAANFEFVQDAEIEKSADGAVQKLTATVDDFAPNDDKPHGGMAVSAVCQKHEGDIYRLQIQSRRWIKNHAQSELNLPPAVAGEVGDTVLDIDTDFTLKLKDRAGNLILGGLPGNAFGVCGNASMFQFVRQPNDRFYGMGEKMFGLELSDTSTKFWNTDVIADFPSCFSENGRPDPLYVSIPYVILRRGDTYIGLLLDNPCATFISTTSSVSIEGLMATQVSGQGLLTLGAEHGQPNLIIIHGPTLPELTRKLQTLVGVTPLPPAWALGYQQCRWGYASREHLEDIGEKMTEHAIPCDGLWLDIEYMNGYRVFTFDAENFPDPKQDIESIQAEGRRVVPIIDPGVKAEPGYEVYESGREADVFCKNPQGREFIGQVWPGKTAFPDFSIDSGRDWWSEQVKRFAQTGIRAAWLDMNDPSTGSVLCTDMRFDHGRESHYTFHNQYALGMARATRKGFESAYPDERIFILSRSGFTGSGACTAIWTGDNFSSYHYLKTSIPCSLNLALSGIPFNGPDVGGFALNTTAPLLRDWFKAGFLFPFFRNHTVIHSQRQEPWAFDEDTLEIIRHYIRLRYKLRPYLYNLFVAHEETGEAILRPLFYDFEQTPQVSLERVNDQFMIGSEIMQAPFVEEDGLKRPVVLPGKRWFAAHRAQWIDGDQTISEPRDHRTTPLFFRDGAILPMADTKDGDFSFQSKQVVFHIVADDKTDEIRDCVYAFDDGISHAYRRGERSRIRVSASSSDGKLDVVTKLLEDGYGECHPQFVVLGHFEQITLNGRRVKPESFTTTIAGRKQKLHRFS